MFVYLSVQGEFKDNQLHGQGTRWIAATGISYIGEWKKFRMEGMGRMVWPDGFQLETEWKESQPVGNNKPRSDLMIGENKIEFIHPELKEKILKGFCTGRDKEEPQPIWRSKWGMKSKYAGLCLTCYKHHSQHQQDFELQWSITCCGCPEECCIGPIE